MRVVNDVVIFLSHWREDDKNSTSEVFIFLYRCHMPTEGNDIWGKNDLYSQSPQTSRDETD